MHVDDWSWVDIVARCTVFPQNWKHLSDFLMSVHLILHYFFVQHVLYIVLSSLRPLNNQIQLISCINALNTVCSDTSLYLRRYSVNTLSVLWNLQFLVPNSSSTSQAPLLIQRVMNHVALFSPRYTCI